MTVMWHEVIGIVGVAFCILAYARLQYRRDFAKTFTYSAMNLAAAILQMISLFYSWNLASVIITLFFGFISIYGLYRCAKYRIRDEGVPS